MNIRHERIDRVILTGPRHEFEKAHSYCRRHGYLIAGSGPMPMPALKKYQVDCSRFKIIAERKEGEGGD